VGGRRRTERVLFIALEKLYETHWRRASHLRGKKEARELYPRKGTPSEASMRKRPF